MYCKTLSNAYLITADTVNSRVINLISNQFLSTFGIASFAGEYISTSFVGDMCIINPGRRIIISTSSSLPAFTINTNNTSNFYGIVAVENGTDPRFQSLTSNGEILVGTATNNGGFFSGTLAGDGCVRSSRNLFLGPINPSTHNIYMNNQIFKFNQNTWQPTIEVVDSTGPQAATITYVNRYGYFSRIGDLVTVFFEVDFSIARPLGSPTMGFITIGNLPVQIGIQQTPGDLQSGGNITSASFPNGIALDLVPAVGVPVFSGAFRTIAYEQGFEAPLYVNAIVNIDYGNWVSTGTNLLLYADCEVFTVALTIPPWSSINSTNTPLSTFHVPVNTTFSGCKFAGSISYLSDY